MDTMETTTNQPTTEPIEVTHEPDPFPGEVVNVRLYDPNIASSVQVSAENRGDYAYGHLYGRRFTARYSTSYGGSSRTFLHECQTVSAMHTDDDESEYVTLKLKSDTGSDHEIVLHGISRAELIAALQASTEY